MPVKDLGEEDFNEAIQKGVVLVDFWAPWCSPCRAFGPVFENAADSNQDVTFCKVNTEEEPDLAIAQGIQAIPTLKVYRDGMLVFEQSGAMPAHALQHLVDEVRVLDMDHVRSEAAKRS